MKKCPYCGHDNDDRNEVCEHCKADISHEETSKESVKSSRKKTRS